MHLGFDDIDLSLGHIRETAVIDTEPSLLNMDVVALRETRIAGNGSQKEKNDTFFLKWLRFRFIGFMVLALPFVIVWSVGQLNYGSLRANHDAVSKRRREVLISSVHNYANTLGASRDAKHSLYEVLSNNAGGKRKDDPFSCLENVSVGNQRSYWAGSLAHHGTGNINVNGQRLVAILHRQHPCNNQYFFFLEKSTQGIMASSQIQTQASNGFCTGTKG